MFQKIANHILSNTGATLPGDFAKLARQQGAGQSTVSKILQGSSAGNAERAEKTLTAFADGETMKGLGSAAIGSGRMLIGQDMAGEGWARAAAVGVRAGAPLAAYGAMANGTRYMSGGSMGTNNQGERDIAGIPFL